MEERTQQARNQKVQGAWAYSDAFDHIVVKIGEHWHGFKLAGAVRMREELDQAISDAEKTDAEYSQERSEPASRRGSCQGNRRSTLLNGHRTGRDR